MMVGSPTGQARRRPYVWWHAHSLEQFEKIRAVEGMRRFLDPEIATAARFARLQLRETEARLNSVTNIDCLWNGEAVHFELTTRPLFMEYAARLYEEALREALRRFPGFTDHVVEDGPELGERRLRFVSGKHHFAKLFMLSWIGQLHREKLVSVAESFRILPDESGVMRRGRRQLRLCVTPDRPKTDRSTLEEVRACLLEGREFPIDPTPRRCDPKLVSTLLTEMTLPELAYLNWKEIRTPLSPADEALFKSLRTFDSAEIARCIADGADPNAINESGDTPLCDLVQNDREMVPELGESWEALQGRTPLTTFEERKACIQVLLDAGAHLDLVGPGGSLPIAMAVLRKDDETLDWLLSLGADDTIEFNDDSYPGDWPPTWDYAISDCSVADCEAERETEERTWRVLCRHRQAPDGTMPGA